MNHTYLKIIGLVIIGIGVSSIWIFDFTQEPEPTETVWEELPITLQVISGENVTDGLREKKITVGETEIQFTVEVENGVEETPSPSVLRELDEAGYYKPYDPSNRGPIMGTVRLPSGDTERMDLTKWIEVSKIHRGSDIQKKEYIDSVFTCDNYNELAWKWKGDSMYGDGFAGTVEEYIYKRAIDECINPKHQEEVDKVYEELKKVNED